MWQFGTILAFTCLLLKGTGFPWKSSIPMYSLFLHSTDVAYSPHQSLNHIHASQATKAGVMWIKCCNQKREEELEEQGNARTYISFYLPFLKSTAFILHLLNYIGNNTVSNAFFKNAPVCIFTRTYESKRRATASPRQFYWVWVVNW